MNPDITQFDIIHSNITSFFRFAKKRASYPFGNMRQVQPETLPKNSNCSSCLQNIKLKNNTT